METFSSCFVFILFGNSRLELIKGEYWNTRRCCTMSLTNINDNDAPIVETPDSINESPKMEDKPVLPWSTVDHQIGIKSFTGYEIKLSGWMRNDIRSARKVEGSKDDVETEHRDAETGGDNCTEEKQPANDVIINSNNDTINKNEEEDMKE